MTQEIACSKDNKGLLMAALYDGDDNRVFTASRTEDTTAYQLFKRQEKKAKELLNLLRRLEAVKIVGNHQKLVQMERKTPFSGMVLLKM